MKTTTSPLAGAGTTSSPGARACALEGMRPVRRCVFNCSAVTVDPPQSAEIDRLDEDFAAGAAAAAMSTVLLDEEALALGAVFARLGAMVSGRCVLSAGRDERKEKGENLR